MQYFYLLHYFTILGILNLTIWKLGEITWLIFLQEMLPLKGPWAIKPLSFQKVISPTIIEKLTIEMQQLASEKKKNKIRNSIIVVSIKKKKASPG